MNSTRPPPGLSYASGLNGGAGRHGLSASYDWRIMLMALRDTQGAPLSDGAIPLYGIMDWEVAATPIAIVDVETTGVNPRTDRVLEIAVVRSESRSDPQLVLNTLIHPQRDVDASQIHGITDADVTDAPSFESIAGDILDATAGCVLAGYNAYFDLRFLRSEFLRVGAAFDPPYFCLMHLRPKLGLGSWCSLTDACVMHGFAISHAHSALDDAFASAQIWNLCRTALARQGVHTFRHLSRQCRYAFARTFFNRPIAGAHWSALQRTEQRKVADVLKRSQLITDTARAAQLKEATRSLLAAHAEMDAVETVGFLFDESPSDKTVLRDIAQHLLAAEVGLVVADVMAGQADWDRLHQLSRRAEQCS